MAKHGFEVLVTVHGWSIPYRFTGELDLTEGASPILEALGEAARRAIADRDSYGKPTPAERPEDRDNAGAACFGTEPDHERARRLATELTQARALADRRGDEVLAEAERADRAEARCASHARSIDFRDHLVTDLIEALKSGGEQPWWMTATHTLDALGKLAAGDVAADKG